MYSTGHLVAKISGRARRARSAPPTPARRRNSRRARWRRPPRSRRWSWLSARGDRRAMAACSSAVKGCHGHALPAARGAAAAEAAAAAREARRHRCRRSSRRRQPPPQPRPGQEDRSRWRPARVRQAAACAKCSRRTTARSASPEDDHDPVDHGDCRRRCRALARASSSAASPVSASVMSRTPYLMPPAKSPARKRGRIEVLDDDLGQRVGEDRLRGRGRPRCAPCARWARR